MAEDEDPVEGGVHQVADDDRDHDRRGAVHGLEALPEHHEEEERQHAGRQAHGVRGRRRDHVGRLARQQHERLGQEQQDGSGSREHEGDDDAALDSARHRGIVAGADGLGHDRVQHHQRAHPEYAETEEVEVAQRHRRQRHGGDVSDEDGVHHAHQHHPDLDEHDGRGQPQHGTQILPPGQEPTGGRGGRAHLRCAGRGSRGKVARLGQQPLREVEPLGQLGDFRAQGVHVLLQRLGVAAAAGHFRVPTAHAAAVRVTEVARDHDDQS